MIGHFSYKWTFNIQDGEMATNEMVRVNLDIING